MAKYSAFKYAEAQYGLSANPAGDVTWIVQVDWDGDGVLDGTNEAAYMTNAVTFRGKKNALQPSQRGGVSGFEGQEYGVAELTFDDTDRRYDPYNTSSPIYPIVMGRKCKISVKDNSANTTEPVFTGYVTNLVPDSESGTATMTVKDGWYWLSTNKLTFESVTLNRDIQSCIILALGEAQLPQNPPYDIKADTQPVRVFNLEGANAAQVVQQLADASLGNFFFTKAGAATFYPRNYNSMTTHNLDQSQIHRQILRGQPWEMIVNNVDVVAHRIIKRKRSDIWSLGDPVYVAASGTATIEADFQVAVEFAISTWHADTQVNGKGSNLTGQFSLEITDYKLGSCTITFTNNSASNGYITELVITGRVLDDSPGTYSDSDATSLAAYGPRYFTLDSPYLQSRNYADAFATIILTKYKDPLTRLVCMIDQREDIQYDYELLDKVAFTSAKLDLSETLYVLGIEHRWNNATGQDVRTTLYLGPNIYDNTSITAEEITEETEIPEEIESPPPTPGTGTTPPGGELPPELGTAVAAVTQGAGVFVTPDLGATTPTWTSKTYSGGTAVDADVMTGNKDYFYVIDDSKCYRVDDMRTVAGSTWETVYDTAVDGTWTSGRLLRVHCWGTDTVYILAADIGASTDAYMLKSVDKGDSWVQIPIRTAAATPTDYTVYTNSGTSTSYAGKYESIQLHKRFDDATLAPWALAIYWVDGGVINATWGSEYPGSISIPDTTLINSFAQGSWGLNGGDYIVVKNTSLSAGEMTTLNGWLDDYFGSGAWTAIPNKTLTKDAARIHMVTINSNSATTMYTYSIWSYPDPNMPSAFDIAQNGSWMYVGFDDDIYKSEDGGYTWFALGIASGAHDILCDRTLSGVFYAWDTDGILRQYTNGAPSGTLNSESPALDQCLRLAQLPGTGALYSLSNGSLEKYQLGSWSDAEATATGGAGLRAFQSTWLGYLTSGDLRFTIDGATFASKEGTGLTVAAPVAFHIIADA